MLAVCHTRQLANTCLLLEVLSLFCLLYENKLENDDDSIQKIWTVALMTFLGALVRQMRSSSSSEIKLKEIMNDKFRIAWLPIIFFLSWLLCHYASLECFANSLWLLASFKIYGASLAYPEQCAQLKAHLQVPLLALLVLHLCAKTELTL